MRYSHRQEHGQVTRANAEVDAIGHAVWCRSSLPSATQPGEFAARRDARATPAASVHTGDIVMDETERA